MSYIRYKDLYTLKEEAKWSYGYLLKEENGKLQIVNTFCANWAKEKGKNEWLLNTKTLTLFKEDIVFEDVDFFKDDAIEPWMLNFPLLDEDVFHFLYIGNFLETFINYKKFPLLKRLEQTIIDSEWTLPRELVGRLIQFIIKENQKDIDCIRVLFPPILEKYV